MSEKDGKPKGLRIRIPYTDIHAITKAAKSYLDMCDKKKKSLQKPQIIPVINNDVCVKPSVIQIWTSSGEVHQLYGFGPFYDQIYTTLHATWKEQTQEK